MSRATEIPVRESEAMLGRKPEKPPVVTSDDGSSKSRRSCTGKEDQSQKGEGN